MTNRGTIGRIEDDVGIHFALIDDIVDKNVGLSIYAARIVILLECRHAQRCRFRDADNRRRRRIDVRRCDLASIGQCRPAAVGRVDQRRAWHGVCYRDVKRRVKEPSFGVQLPAGKPP